MVRTGSNDATAGLERVARHDGIVLVFGDELADQDHDFGKEAALYIFLGTHFGPASAQADFILPITTFAEEEGTFTNLEGRVQRFWPALLPPGDARPAWLILGAVLAELTGSTVSQCAADSFAQLTTRVSAFADLTYKALGTSGAQIR